MKIKTYPEKILRIKTKTFNEWDDIEKIISEMKKCMYTLNGIGLAANQIGLNKSLFISGLDDTKVFINPSIEYFGKMVLKSEGCLSFPNVQLNIKRYEKVKIAYQNMKGNFCELETDGLLSHIIQHEYDHLNGKLMIDYLPFYKRKKYEPNNYL
jgi:peptide deformylase